MLLLPVVKPPGVLFSNGPLALFSSFFKTIGFLINFLISFFRAIISLIFLILENLHWILLLIIIVFLSAFWFAGHKEITENVEQLYRVHIFPIWDEIIRPLFEELVSLWNNVICWFNALGLIGRLFGKGIILKTLRRCDNVDFFQTAYKFSEFLVATIQNTLVWFFTVNNLQSNFPGYIIFKTLSPVIEDFTEMLTCLCKDLKILWFWLGTIWKDDLLSCAFHQLINSIISIYQMVINFVISLIQLANDVIQNNGGFSDFIDALSTSIGGNSTSTYDFTLPSTTPTFEKINAFANIFGKFLDRSLQITLCVGSGVLDGDFSLNFNNTNTDLEFDKCMDSGVTKFNFFCILGPFVSILSRSLSAVFQLLIHTGVIFKNLSEKPPTDRYLLTEWIKLIDIVLDTIRFPPLKYDNAVRLQNPPIINGSNISSIVQPNAELYGEYSFPINITCNSTTTDRTIIPCAECDYVQDEDIETCLCRLASDLDRISVDFFGFKVFDGLICCLTGRIIRTGVSIVRPAIIFTTYLLNYDKLSEFVTDQNHFETIITELIGRPKELDGILECIHRLIVGFDSRLQCLGDLIILPIKSMGELVRMFFITVIRLSNDMLGTNEPGFFQYMCIGDVDNCIDLEDVFTPLRKQRDNDFLNFDFQRTEINSTAGLNQGNAWIDCFEYFVSFDFANQFLDPPLESLPDFSCGLVYGFRGTVGIVKFGVELFLSVLDSLGSVLDNTRPIRFTPIQYIACNSSNLCWNGPQIVSELQDYIKCPCKFLLAIEAFILYDSQKAVFCVCDYMDGIAQTGIFAIKATGTLVSAIAQLIECLRTGFPEPPCIGILGGRFGAAFDYYSETVDTIGFIVSGTGCIIGSLFRFNCLGTPSWPNVGSTCQGGTPAGTCAMNDRTRVLFFDVYRVLTVTVKFFIKLTKSLVGVAFEFGTSLLLSGFQITLSEFVLDILLALGDPVFGTAFSEIFVPPTPSPPTPNPLPTPTTSAPVPSPVPTPLPTPLPTPTPDPEDIDTEGLFQSVGLWVNCLVGPEGCSENPGEGGCFGNIFWRFGNLIRRIYKQLSYFISSFIGIIESITCNKTSNYQ